MKQNSFYNLKNILIVLDVEIREIFRELDYSFSKKEIEDLDFINKSKIIDFNYKRIIERLGTLLHELSISFTHPFSNKKEIIDYSDKVFDELFLWLEDYYAHLFAYFDIDYSQDDHEKIFNDTGELIDVMNIGLTMVKRYKDGNVIHFPKKNSSPMNTLLSINTNCTHNEEANEPTEVNLILSQNRLNQRKSIVADSNYLIESDKSVDERNRVNPFFVMSKDNDCDASVELKNVAINLIESNNEFGYKLWQEKPFDLVTESFIKSWVDGIYYNSSDPENKKVFAYIKEYFINKTRSETS